MNETRGKKRMHDPTECYKNPGFKIQDRTNRIQIPSVLNLVKSLVFFMEFNGILVLEFYHQFLRSQSVSPTF